MLLDCTAKAHSKVVFLSQTLVGPEGACETDKGRGSAARRAARTPRLRACVVYEIVCLLNVFTLTTSMCVDARET